MVPVIMPASPPVMNSLGLVPVQYDAKTKIVSYQVGQPLRDKNYSVILTATVAGKRAETRWDFMFDASKAPPLTAPAGAASPKPLGKP